MVAEISTALQGKMLHANADDLIEVIICVDGIATTSDIADLMRDDYIQTRDEQIAAVRRVKKTVEGYQKLLFDDLSRQSRREDVARSDAFISPVTQGNLIWIANAICIHATPMAIEKLKVRRDVERLELNVSQIPQEWMAVNKVLTEDRERNCLPGSTDAPEISWNVDAVGAPNVWSEAQGEGVVVAVIDAPINFSHPDLKCRKWRSARYPQGGAVFEDDLCSVTHGTYTGGIVAGDGTKGLATGIAPRAELMSLGAGRTECGIWRAMQFAVENRADVVNMSLTREAKKNPHYKCWRHACEVFLIAGILHSNSAGNEGKAHDSCIPGSMSSQRIPHNIGPAGCCPPPWLAPEQPQRGGLSSSVTCGALAPNGKLQLNSGRGPVSWETMPYNDYIFEERYDCTPDAQTGLSKPDICAPGDMTCSTDHGYSENSTSPYNSPYGKHGSTSAASPHVAGAFALIASACKTGDVPVSPRRVQEAIYYGAKKINDRNYNEVGAGALRIDKAFEYGRRNQWW